EGVKYPLAVVLALGALALLIALVPSDPRALSLDFLGASPRFGRTVTIPLEIKAPELDQGHDAGGSAPAAAAPAGQAGRRDAPRAAGRGAVERPAPPTNARE